MERTQKFNEMWQPKIKCKRIPENMQLCVQLSFEDWAKLLEDVLEIDDVKAMLESNKAELNLSINKKNKKFVMFEAYSKKLKNDGTILLNFTDYSIKTKNLNPEKRYELFKKYCSLLAQKAHATPSHLKSMESRFYFRERILVDHHEYSVLQLRKLLMENQEPSISKVQRSFMENQENFISKLSDTTAEELRLCNKYSLLFRNKAERARREARQLRIQESESDK